MPEGPLLRLIFTSPEVRSPYSAEGMPRTISTLSMSSVEIARISTPFPADSRAEREESEVVCSWEEVLIGTPSTRKDVPSEDVL